MTPDPAAVIATLESIRDAIHATASPNSESQVALRFEDKSAIEAALTALRQGPDLYVPGEWVCQTCGFVVSKNFLHATDMSVSVDTRVVQDVCPNDGTSLRQQTWRERAEEAQRCAVQQMDARVQAKAERDELKASLADAVTIGMEAEAERDAARRERDEMYAATVPDSWREQPHAVLVGNAICHREDTETIDNLDDAEELGPQLRERLKAGDAARRQVAQIREWYADTHEDNPRDLYDKAWNDAAEAVLAKLDDALLPAPRGETK